MKIKLLLLLLILSGMEANAQCGPTLPPPGLTPVYGLDTDNDGFALFDIGYFIENIDRPEMESFFGVSSSGYSTIFTAGGVTQSSLLYTNTSPNEQCGLQYIYSGSGPEFQQQPPCYYPVVIYLGKGLVLFAVPYDGDEDNDGVLNRDEDTNNNQNLMDDDDDNDGIINLKDATNDLAVSQNPIMTLSIYPNPVSNGILTFESNVGISKVIIYDLSGKLMVESKISSNALLIDTLATGMYFVKFQSDSGTVTKKVAIK